MTNLSETDSAAVCRIVDAVVQLATIDSSNANHGELDYDKAVSELCAVAVAIVRHGDISTGGSDGK